MNGQYTTPIGWIRRCYSGYWSTGTTGQKRGTKTHAQEQACAAEANNTSTFQVELFHYVTPEQHSSRRPGNRDKTCIRSKILLIIYLP